MVVIIYIVMIVIIRQHFECYIKNYIFIINNSKNQTTTLCYCVLCVVIILQ